MIFGDRRFFLAAALGLLMNAPGAAQPTPEPPPLSKDCQTPGVTISGNRSLPNVQNALKNRKTIRILTLGASSSAGTQGMRGPYFEAIESLLQKTIPGVDVQMIDRGVSGELARDAADRLPTEVALNHPDIVLWQLGTNDALARAPLDEFETSVVGALRWLKEHDVDVALVGLHYVHSLKTDPTYQAVRAAVRRIAEEQKVLLIRRYEAMQLVEQAQNSLEGRAPNEFALTEFGYSCLAEYVVRAVTSGVFARPSKPGPAK